MNLLLAYFYSLCFFFFFFSFFPKPACSFCQTQLCGTNEIKYPFSLKDSANPCHGLYEARCHTGNLEIKFDDRSWYAVKKIDYSRRTLTVLDRDLGNTLDPKYCNFLYVLHEPFHGFVPPRSNQFKNYSTCSREDHKYLESFIPEFYNLIPCKSYSVYLLNSWMGSSYVFYHSNCKVDAVHWRPPVEYVMSYSGYKNDLSLKSFGYSAKLKLVPQCFNNQLCRTDSNTALVIGVSTAGGLSFIMFSYLCFLLYRRWKKKRLSSSTFLDRSTSFVLSSKNDPEMGSSPYPPPIFSYDELYEATHGFDASNELGDGGFGTVYKGKLRDGRVVAVKRLYENNYRRVEQFMNEVKILSLLRHQHLVSLYGCTSHRSRELLLVYEFIPNGTVADHLHGSRSSASVLPWKTRMKIAIETADALSYLHSVEPQIIHRDVKTNNILLDDSFNVKVADFGLSRLCPLEATHVSTAPQGTLGYVDPEYHQFFQLTDKSDVYSFGVVLMELISSKPAVDMNREKNHVNLANMAITKIQKQELHEFVDPQLGFLSDYRTNEMVTKVAELAFLCLQTGRERRPAIKEVIEILRGVESCREVEVPVKEETRLLKGIPPYSPDSVTERWVSTSSSLSSTSTGECC